MSATLKTEAKDQIIAASGKTPENVDTEMCSIARLVEDIGMAAEKISDTLFVVRNVEGRFDFWMFCKYGYEHKGQTIVATTAAA